MEKNARFAVSDVSPEEENEQKRPEGGGREREGVNLLRVTAERKRERERGREGVSERGEGMKETNLEEVRER